MGELYDTWIISHWSCFFFKKRKSWGLRKFSPDKDMSRGASSIRERGRRPRGQSQGSRQKWLELWWAGHQRDLHTKCVPWKIILNDTWHRGGDPGGAEREGSLTLKRILWWSGESWGAWAGVTTRQMRRDRAQACSARREWPSLHRPPGCWLCWQVPKGPPQGVTVATRETETSPAITHCVHSSRSACPSLFKNKYSQGTLAGGTVNRHCLSKGNMKHFRKCLRM